jgi:hypothetical protein
MTISLRLRCNPWLASIAVHTLVFFLWFAHGFGSDDPGSTGPTIAVPRPRPVSVSMADPALVRQLQHRSRPAEPDAPPARSTPVTPDPSSGAPPQAPAPSPRDPQVGLAGSPSPSPASLPAAGQPAPSPAPTPTPAVIGNPTPSEALGLGSGPGHGRSGSEGSCDWTRLPSWPQLRQLVSAQGWSLLVVDDSNAINLAQSIVAPDDGRTTFLRDISADVTRLLPPGARWRVLIRLPAEANEAIRTSQRVLVWSQAPNGQWVLE